MTIELQLLLVLVLVLLLLPVLLCLISRGTAHRL
jgi:hypothetical protein